jgi:hypothetical protein
MGLCIAMPNREGAEQEFMGSHYYNRREDMLTPCLCSVQYRNDDIKRVPGMNDMMAAESPQGQ